MSRALRMSGIGVDGIRLGSPSPIQGSCIGGLGGCMLAAPLAVIQSGTREGVARCGAHRSLLRMIPGPQGVSLSSLGQGQPG
jgi:hypothetical protein